MLDLIVPATFEDMQRADDIAVDVSMRILERVAHARLRREMHDFAELFFRK